MLFNNLKCGCIDLKYILQKLQFIAITPSFAYELYD